MPPSAQRDNETKEKKRKSRPNVTGRTENGSEAKIRLVRDLLTRIEEKIGEKDYKASVSDLIRLLQLQKELEEELPREITIRWIEPTEEAAAAET